MDTQRLILVVIFSMSLLFLWEAWQKQHQPAAPVAQQTQPPAAGVPTPSVPTAAPAAPQATPAVPAAPESAKTRDVVTVVTDLVRAEIDLAGGEIVVLDLLQHKDTVDLNKSYLLLNPAYRYAAQSGLLGPGLPTHKAAYTAVAREFKLADGQDKLEVRLETTTPEGLKAAKILTFRRGSYVIDVTHEFTNPKSEPIPAHAYFQLTRDDKAPPGDQAMLQTFTGVGVFTDSGKYQKVSWSDIAKNKTPYPKTADNGWIGVVQHYFVSAIVPPEKAEREYYTREIAKDLFSAGVILPLGSVAPGATATATTRLYSGPQDQDQLKALAPGLDLVVDYGWLTIIAAPLFWVLKLLHGWFGNWGLAIIGLTVLIKAIFYPLSAASYKSMAKMKQVTPRLMKIREQYSNDRAKMNQAMMELYKTEKINPLGGCLPIVVQIPAAQRAVLRLDQGSLRAGPVLRPAGADDDLDDRADEVESHAARSGAGEGDDDHAVRVRRDVLLLPRGPGALLARQQHPVDRAAVADHPHDRRVRQERRAQAVVGRHWRRRTLR